MAVNKRSADRVQSSDRAGSKAKGTVKNKPVKPRRVFSEAKHRGREARKLLKRGRKSIPEAAQAEIRQVLDELHRARRAKDVKACENAFEKLDTLVDDHLARYRKSAFREYSESIGLAVLFALMLRAFVVEAFQIPSESMVPTLLVGDHLFVNKFVYGVRIPFTRFDIIDFGDPERGDVVVFIYPVEEVRTEVELLAIMDNLQEHENGSENGFPADLNEIGMPALHDAWGTPFRYERIDAGDYTLTSAGPDEAFGTGDDIVRDSHSVPNPAWRARGLLDPAVRSRLAGILEIDPHELVLPECMQPENLEEAKDYIKRVIGIPGDRIRVEDGRVYVNDEPIPSRSYTSGHVQRDTYGRLPTQHIERLGDAEYVVQHVGRINDFDEIEVREGYIFVMGDNRDNSSDSRCWGQVPIENVKGEAMFLFWSGGSGGGFLGNRWNRMLHGVE